MENDRILRSIRQSLGASGHLCGVSPSAVFGMAWWVFLGGSRKQQVSDKDRVKMCCCCCCEEPQGDERVRERGGVSVTRSVMDSPVESV